jgi:hypothetical protein
MVESAWTAGRTHSHWRARFAPLKKRIGKQKAIVAIARKLLVVVWNVLNQLAVDRQADIESVALVHDLGSAPQAGYWARIVPTRIRQAGVQSTRSPAEKRASARRLRSD